MKDVFAKHRHRRGRDRPDAAERRRRLRHAEAARGVARSAQSQERRSSRRSRHAADEVPGSNYEFTQPIQMRFNELISGVRSDVGVKVFGDDLDVLQRSCGARSTNVLARRPPARRDVKVEQVTGLPMLTVNLDRARACALRAERRRGAGRRRDRDRRQGGRAVFEGDRRFDRRAAAGEPAHRHRRDAAPADRAAARARRPDASVRSVASAADAAFVPLGEVAELESDPGPNQISRENGKRRVVVTRQRARPRPRLVRRRGAASRSSEGQAPARLLDRWGGQFEQLHSATQRLRRRAGRAAADLRCCSSWPSASLKDALLVFTGVPLALTGGVVALWLRDIPLSISAGVGFIALSGVAVLNGLVMVSFINQLRAKARPLDDAIPKAR